MRRPVRLAAAAIGGLSSALGKSEARTGGLVILGYHRIDTGGGLGIHPDEFFGHLEWIDATGWPVVEVDAPPAPVGELPRVAITFDDGYRSVADIAWPELRRRGWPATLYVVAGCLEPDSRLPWDTGGDDASLVDVPLLTDLFRDGMRIGAHSWSHRYLPHVPPDDWGQELAGTRDRLEDLLGAPVTSFAYPAGGWHRRLRGAVAAAGYQTAVTCDRGRNLSGADPLSLRRHIVEAAPVSLADQVRGRYDFLRPIDGARRHIRNIARAR